MGFLVEIVIGGIETGGRDDDSGLLVVRVVTKRGTKFLELGPVLTEKVPITTGASIIGKPDVGQVWELGAKVAADGKRKETVQDHGEGTALSDSSTAEEGNAGAAIVVDDEDGEMAVAVECEGTTTGPLVTSNPEDSSAVSELEGIVGIDLNESKVGFFGVRIPNFVSSMNAALDASLKTTAELIGATSGGGFRAGNLDDSLGNSSAPDLADTYRTSAAIGLGESKEAVTHQRSDGTPGYNGISKPLSEGAESFTESRARVAASKEPGFKGVGVSATETCCTMEFTSHGGDMIIRDLNLY